MEALKEKLPVIIRYLLVAGFATLGARGFFSPETMAILTQNMDIIVGAIGGLATLAYALWKRPTAKAMEVAKQVDAQIPKGDTVVIQTPGPAPNIVVSPKP